MKISIRTKRVAEKLTQAELAKRLGVYQGAVSQWESGMTNPKLDKLKAMAELFGCTLDELLREDGQDDQAENRPGVP